MIFKQQTSHYRHWRALFERRAGSEALSKLNLIFDQLYKIPELDLFSKGKALNEENLAKARIIFWSQKIVFLHFLLLSYPLRAISDVCLYNCLTDHKSQVCFSRAKSCKCAQSTKAITQYQKRIHDRNSEANKKLTK